MIFRSKSVSGCVAVLLLLCMQFAQAVEPVPAMRLLFDSTTDSVGDGAFIHNRVQANFIVTRVAGESDHYRGFGRLSYVELSGLPHIGSDGILDIELFISPDDGSVSMFMFPGDPKPSEWVDFSPAPPLQFFQWFGVFGFFHIDELGVGGFRIENWDYLGLPQGIFARKTYNNSQSDSGVTNSETTIISLADLNAVPYIQALHQESSGQAPNKPETGEQLRLYADIFKPPGYVIDRCTWTGNNFAGQGIGDPNNNCSWSYTPKTGPGPERATYGEKSVQLTIVYKHGSPPATGFDTRTDSYKVYFPKKKDDDSNNQPNWFDYWGDDGAVPGLDASDVVYDPAETSFGVFNPSTGNVYIGPSGAENDSALTIASTVTPPCPGVSLPAVSGIHLTAVTLAHELKHKETDGQVGTDSDSDGVPDGSEAGTDPNNPDSCNLAGVIHPDYSTYGDDEFIARKAEDGVTGVVTNDWALPGKQAGAVAAAALTAARGESSWQRSGPVMEDDARLTLSAADVRAIQSNLTGVYSESTENLDGDGLYDSLIISIGVNVTVADNYDVVVWLADGNSTEFVWAASQQALAVGSHAVDLRFDGRVLNAEGVTGPFSISRVELRAEVGKHTSLQDSAITPFVSSFGPNDFDPYAAAFNGAISEQGVDTGTDGLFDRLEIDVTLDVRDAGNYQVVAELEGINLGMTASAAGAYAAGLHTIKLEFDGAGLYQYRENGPYQLSRLRVMETISQELLDNQLNPLTTVAYTYDQFQHGGITINPAGYSELAIDVDTNGVNEQLQIGLTGDSVYPGPYTVSANLESNAGIRIAHASDIVGLGGTGFSAQPFAVNLVFDGQMIHASAINGPYTLTDVTLLNDAGEMVDRHPVAFTTSAYAFTDFVQDLSAGLCFEIDGAVNIADKTYEGIYECLARLSVSADSNVQIGTLPVIADVTFAAGQSIRLGPGFSVFSGSRFSATVDATLLTQ